ncbi:hypothetical protein HGA64_03980, partial [Candidatus Falkowbacteria bacterium]|nr:hypothetical protein [Candidatus Falkowbacteria bacterium]
MKEIAPSYTEKTETAKIDYLDLSYQTVEDEIPLGLQGFWIKEIEKTEDHETIYNRILEAIQKIRRNNSAEISDDDYIINFAAEIPTEVEKRKAQILQDIKQIVRNQPEIIGDGNTAVVYIKRLENNKKSKYCIKVINNTNAPDYKNNNDIKEEFRLLEKVCKIEVDGVRASQPYAYVQNKGVHFLVM